MLKERYTVSPYSYYGESSRPRTYSVWDTEKGEWTGDYVGDKQRASEIADELNYQYYTCPDCEHIQVETATIEEIQCEGCGHKPSLRRNKPWKQ